MKISLATHYYPEHVGGIESLARDLAVGLCARGHSVSWLALGAESVKTEAFARVSLVGTNIIESRWGLPLPILYPRSCSRIFKAVAESDVVIIHDVLYMASAAAFLAARFYKKPSVVVQHVGLVPYRNPVLRGLMHLANATIGRLMLRRADRVVFYSTAVKSYFERIGALSKEPEFIPFGVDTSLFAPKSPEESLKLRWSFDLPQSQPVVLFVGRFTEKKGMEIIREVARSLPEMTFALAGRGELNPQAWELPNVRVLGRLGRQQLAALYNASDLLILPSTGEGFPVVLQEALACGLPCITTAETLSNMRIPTDICRPCTRSAPAFVTAINETRALFQQGPGLGLKAAEYASQQWSSSTCISSYEALLGKLVRQAVP